MGTDWVPGFPSRGAHACNRAISDQFEGNESNYAYYRKKIVQFMAEQPDNFSPFVVDMPWEEVRRQTQRRLFVEGRRSLLCLRGNVVIIYLA